LTPSLKSLLSPSLTRDPHGPHGSEKQDQVEAMPPCAAPRLLFENKGNFNKPKSERLGADHGQQLTNSKNQTNSN